MYLVLIESMCHTRIVLQGIMHVCNFWDLLVIMNIYLSNLYLFQRYCTKGQSKDSIPNELSMRNSSPDVVVNQAFNNSNTFPRELVIQTF